MAWERVDISDITVQSDSDGYSESVSVGGGETVHVDTHATSSVSQYPINFTGAYGITKTGPFHVPVYLNRVREGYEWAYDVTAEKTNDNGNFYLIGYDGSGNEVFSLYLYSNGTTKSASGTCTGLKKVVLDTDSSYADIGAKAHINQLEIQQSVSNSVVTDDIHL